MRAEESCRPLERFTTPFSMPPGCKENTTWATCRGEAEDISKIGAGDPFGLSFFRRVS